MGVIPQTPVISDDGLIPQSRLPTEPPTLGYTLSAIPESLWGWVFGGCGIEAHSLIPQWSGLTLLWIVLGIADLLGFTLYLLRRQLRKTDHPPQRIPVEPLGKSPDSNGSNYAQTARPSLCLIIAFFCWGVQAVTPHLTNSNTYV